jgi:homoaconitase/3-isopropylmalate dehydratase large subunit
VGKNLYQKVWNDHVVGQLESGQYQLFIALHLIHEVTSPQAFGMLNDKGLKVRYRPEPLPPWIILFPRTISPDPCRMRWPRR